MVTFIAVYRGASIQEAQMVAVSVNTALAAKVADHILQEQNLLPQSSADAVRNAIHQGRQHALHLIKSEAE